MSAKELLIATHNKGKVIEFESLLSGRFNLASKDFPDVEETGSTYEENAVLKAKSAYEHTGIPSLADDSGLSLADLRGAPGIYSARYAGVHGNFTLNKAKILAELKNIKPDGLWLGAYVCCLAYYDHAGPSIFWGFCNGDYREQARGDNGFGYDSNFYPVEAGGRLSMAELSMSKKNSISHRGIATRKFLELMG